MLVGADFISFAPPQAAELIHFVAPPLPDEPAALGFVRVPFYHVHDRIIKAIGAGHVRLHDLRHTFATLALKNGVDVKTLSAALGYFSAGFTLNTYTHATPQMKRDAAVKIGEVVDGRM